MCFGWCSVRPPSPWVRAGDWPGCELALSRVLASIFSQAEERKRLGIWGYSLAEWRSWPRPRLRHVWCRHARASSIDPMSALRVE